MALSDTALRNAKPTEKPYKLYGERGLYVIVNPIEAHWKVLGFTHAAHSHQAIELF